MFPSQRPQYLHWTELPRRKKRLSCKRATTTGVAAGSGALDAAPLMKMVSIPIPFKQSTTAPSRFSHGHTDDFSHLTVSQAPFQPNANLTASTDYSFLNEDYITFAEKLLPRLTTIVNTDSVSEVDPDSISEPSTSGVSSHFRPDDVRGGWRSPYAAKSKSKKTGSSRSQKTTATATGRKVHTLSPTSSLSIGSITSSIVKPVEVKFRNKNAVAGIRRWTPRLTVPGLESVLDTKAARAGRSGHGRLRTTDSDGDSEVVLPSRISFCSNIERRVNTQMTHKTQADRELMIKLCNEAVKRRQSSLEYYTGLVDEEMTKVETAVDNYQPDMRKRELQDLMLSYVKHREGAVKKDNDKGKGSSSRPRSATCWHKETRVNDGHRYLPVYCLQGRTYLGGSNDHPRQPHTFAHLVTLKNPSHDPPGYRRFSKLVNMQGFNSNEILIHVRGNQIRVDGFALSKRRLDPYASSADMLRKSRIINMPKGVYPERLVIGRSSNGVLVVQEPWKF